MSGFLRAEDLLVIKSWLALYKVSFASSCSVALFGSSRFEIRCGTGQRIGVILSFIYNLLLENRESYNSV